MEEIIKALKIFLISMVLITLLQIKYQGLTLERRGLMSLRNSSIGQNLQDVASGAVLVAQRSYAWTKNVVQETFSDSSVKSSESSQRATR